MGIEVVTSVDNFNRIVKALNFMETNEVYVGISDETTTREKGEPVTNAELLFIHTNGSPVNNIPARPVIEPAIKDDKDRLAQMMDSAFEKAEKGKFNEALDKLKLAGMRAQNVCRAWFTNPKNGWPPNSPSVQERKRAKGSTDPKPLIDTGELRKSITYFVRTKTGTKIKISTGGRSK